MYYLYVIQNEKGKRYIGQTNNIENRLQRHNGVLKNKKGSFTSINKGIWKVIYSERYNTRSEAVERERLLKSHKGRDWLKEKLGP